MPPTAEQIAALIDAVPTERARLVRLCRQITDNADVAEDLAQETLSEAWQHLHKLSAPQGVALWLSAIARNVCLRWLSRQGKEAALLSLDRSTADESSALPSLAQALADDEDIEMELGRHELADLLDRALAMLSPEARTLLIARYIQELPHAEIAARLHMSEGAVKMRVQRGRLALRRVLTTDLRQEALSYDLLDTEETEWQSSRIWCPGCGQNYLLCRFLPDSGTYMLRCPACHVAPGTNYADTSAERENTQNIFEGITKQKPLLSRLMTWGGNYYRDALATRNAVCSLCGGPALMRLYMPEWVPLPQRYNRGLHLACLRCHNISQISLRGLALWLPDGRRFWRAHPRIYMLPEREVERAEGRVIVISFQSITDSAQLDVFFARETYEVLDVHTNPTR